MCNDYGDYGFRCVSDFECNQENTIKTDTSWFFEARSVTAISNYDDDEDDDYDDDDDDIDAAGLFDPRLATSA